MIGFFGARNAFFPSNGNNDDDDDNVDYDSDDDDDELRTVQLIFKYLTATQSGEKSTLIRRTRLGIVVTYRTATRIPGELCGRDAHSRTRAARGGNAPTAGRPGQRECPDGKRAFCTFFRMRALTRAYALEPQPRSRGQ